MQLAAAKCDRHMDLKRVKNVTDISQVETKFLLVAMETNCPDSFRFQTLHKYLSGDRLGNVSDICRY